MKPLFTVILVLITSCSPLNIGENFFHECNVCKIKAAPLDAKYREYYVEDDFPQLGKIRYPISNLSLKYDTISHYLVVFNGFIFFKQNDSILRSENMVKIKLDKILLVKEGKGFSCFTKDNISSKKTFPVPYSIMKRLKNDFLYTNRNASFENVNLSTECDSFPISCSYKLY